MATSPRVKPAPNDLGVVGWGWAGRYGLERYLYVLHRITGLGILLYLTLHILATSVRIFGETTWKTTMETLHHPIFRFGEYLVFAGFVFHALNGIRLIFQELGYGLGKPTPPVFPYSYGLKDFRFIALLVIFLAALGAIVAFYDMFLV
jgi:succinate dehydrogenase / fumarate reductase cytochrome b subunit